MYQAGVEAIMGFRLLGTTLVIDPCILRAWTGNEIDFRYHSARYEIVVDNPQGVSRGVASNCSTPTTPSPSRYTPTTTTPWPTKATN